jgi:hypothetical protein
MPAATPSNTPEMEQQLFFLHHNHQLFTALILIDLHHSFSPQTLVTGATIIYPGTQVFWSNNCFPHQQHHQGPHLH